MDSSNSYVYGDCVSTQEAFAKATAAPQTFIPRATQATPTTKKNSLDEWNQTDTKIMLDASQRRRSANQIAKYNGCSLSSGAS